jgi:hypothetical protein
MKRLFLFSFLHLCFVLISQTVIESKPAPKKEEEKVFYFRDTTFTASGVKFEITEAKGTWDKFKCSIYINNPTKNYVIIDPEDIRGHIKGSDKSHHNKKDQMLVVAPNSSNTFQIKFTQYEFRYPAIDLRLDKIGFSDSIFAIYDFKDISLSEENQRVNGPVIWSYYKQDVDQNDGIRIHGKLRYHGDKFLFFYPENAVFKSSKGNFNSVVAPKTIGSFNNTYYDRYSISEKTLFSFPVKKKETKKGSKATMDLIGVFKEYSIKKAEGFTITLVKAPDHEGKKKGRKNSDTD